MHKTRVKDFFIGNGEPLTIISGPCIIESETHCLQCAEALEKIFRDRNINLIFKASYDKANRSSINSFRGPGLQEGLRILERVKDEFGFPIITDVHLPEDTGPASEVCDVLQIPAFLCRQTDLILAAARTGKTINVKKGQFIAPWDMAPVVEKIRSAGNPNIILTERGTTFGYNNLVTDLRSIPIMKKLGVPVCYDATHSAQLPGSLGAQTGGQREYIPTMALAAVAAGANCLFIESHPDPAKALSDSTTVLDLADLPALLRAWEEIYTVVNTLGAGIA